MTSLTIFQPTTLHDAIVEPSCIEQTLRQRKQVLDAGVKAMTIVHHLNAAFEEEATPVVERSTAAIRGFVALGVMKLLPSAGDVPWSTEPGAVPPEQNLERREADMDQWS